MPPHQVQDVPSLLYTFHRHFIQCKIRVDSIIPIHNCKAMKYTCENKTNEEYFCFCSCHFCSN